MSRQRATRAETLQLTYLQTKISFVEILWKLPNSLQVKGTDVAVSKGEGKNPTLICLLQGMGKLG